MGHSYQLTKYPLGTKREFWALAWPLMIGLISSTFMVFVDRLFLARFHPMALNAAASSSMAYYVFLTVPMSIAAISEVLVGRFNGEGRFTEVGRACWQMALFSLLLTPLFWGAAFSMPNILFWQSENMAYETAYFETLMFFGPIQCMAIALNGFFIGVGKMSMVTIAAIIGNLFNIVLDYFLIAGHFSFPALGIRGAALATGIAQLIQIVILLGFYWSKTNRKIYGTNAIGLYFPYLKEGLRIGGPAGFGNASEIVAHYIFFCIVSKSGSKDMTLVAMVQSFYILFSFIVEAQSKSASAVISNLLGARRFDPIPKVLKSAFSLQFIFFLVVFASVFIFQEQYFGLFMSDNAEIMSDPVIKKTFFASLLLMSVFFLFDGLSWIMIGFITAAEDTKYVFFTSLFVPWIAYICPTILFIGVNKGGASTAWGILVFMSFTNFTLYFWRYLSGKWQSHYTLDQYQLDQQQAAAA